MLNDIRFGGDWIASFHNNGNDWGICKCRDLAETGYDSDRAAITKSHPRGHKEKSKMKTLFLIWNKVRKIWLASCFLLIFLSWALFFLSQGSPETIISVK